jgi:putative DNA-invertase from lambdoid prophage Rac
VTETIRQLMARGVVVRTVINGLIFDGATKDPMQKAVRNALIAFMAAMAEAQAEATREAQRAGIAHAKATERHSYRGRKPSFDRTQLGIIRDLLAQNASPTAISDAAGVSRQVVYRVQDDPAKAEAMLAEWGV